MTNACNIFLQVLILYLYYFLYRLTILLLVARISLFAFDEVVVNIDRRFRFKDNVKSAWKLLEFARKADCSR